MPSNQEASYCADCGLRAQLGITSRFAQYVLCRYRHKTYCAERLVMPSCARNPRPAQYNASWLLGIIFLH